MILLFSIETMKKNACVEKGGKVETTEGFLAGKGNPSIKQSVLKFAEEDGKSVEAEVFVFPLFLSHIQKLEFCFSPFVFEIVGNSQNQTCVVAKRNTDWRIDDWREDEGDRSVVSSQDEFRSRFRVVAWRIERGMWGSDVDVDLLGVLVGCDFGHVGGGGVDRGALSKEEEGHGQSLEGFCISFSHFLFFDFGD